MSALQTPTSSLTPRDRGHRLPKQRYIEYIEEGESKLARAACRPQRTAGSESDVGVTSLVRGQKQAVRGGGSPVRPVGPVMAGGIPKG